MPVNVGTLVIDLVAGTASFSAAMDKMSALSAKTANDISRSLMKISVAGTAAVGAIVGGFVAMTKSTLESVGALDRMAQQTGTTVETLSLLEYAASTTGVETETLTNSLVKLSKAELAASTGNVQLQNVFKKLGVETTDGNKHLRDSGTVYEELAVKFAGMQDGATKTALALQLFGKSGASQIPLLNRLGTEIASIRDEAQRLGLIVGTDTANAMHQSEEELKKLELTFKAVKLAIVTEALPAINQLLTQLFEIAKNADIPGLMRTFGDAAAKAIVAFGEAVAFASKHVTELKVALEAIAALQIARILVPLAAGLASGGIANLGAGVARFTVSLLGLQKVIPVLATFSTWLVDSSKFVALLASEEGILSAATYVLEGALAAIGGPIGAAVLAFTSLSGILYALRDRTFTLSGEVYKLRDAFLALADAVARWVATGSLLPFLHLKESLDAAKRAREYVPKGPSTSLMGRPSSGAPAKTQPDITGLAKPEKDIYKETIDKLNLAIAAQSRYIGVLHGTPEAIAAVASAEKAEGMILQMNNELRDKGKPILTTAQQNEIKQRVAIEDSAKATRDFGQALENEQHQQELAAAQASVLAAAHKKGADAVRDATVSNAILAATVGKTRADIVAMGTDIEKAAAHIKTALDVKAVSDFSIAIDNQTARLKLDADEAAVMAEAIGKGDAAIAKAKITIALMEKGLGATAGQMKILKDRTDEITAAMTAAAAQQQTEQAAQQLKALQDEAEAQRILTGAVFGTIDAQRQAEEQVKVKAIDDAIMAASDQKVKDALEAVRQQMLDNMRAANAYKDTQAALAPESPEEVFARETDALNHQIEALKAAHGGMISYGEAVNIAAKQEEIFNKQIDATVKQLLSSNNLMDGVRAFFLDMEKQAQSAASIIYDALHSTFDKLSKNLADLIMTGKANFGAMLKDIGHQMVEQSTKAMLQQGLGALAKGPLGKMMGLDKLLKPKADGSKDSPYYVIISKGGPAAAGGSGGGIGLPSAGDESDSGGVWDEKGATDAIQAIGGLGKFGGVLSKLFSAFGGAFAGGGEVNPGQAYLVGERGPELYTPGESGSITPSDASRRLLTGGETPAMHYYNIDARGTDPALTEQRTRQAIIMAHNSAVMTSTQVQQEKTARTPPMPRR